MHQSIAEQVQSFATGDLVTLYQLDTALLGGPVFAFTDSTDNGSPVIFDGITYSPIDLESDGWEANGQGSFPTPTLRISNTNRIIGAAVITYNDLVGAKVTRLRTFRQFLDNGTTPDPTAMFPSDIYYVERKVAHNKIFVEWELSATMDQQGRQLPARQCLKNACTHTYRTHDGTDFDYTNATCPYNGTGFFEANSQATDEAGDDVCGKRLKDCRLRFGESAVLPFRGFPGMGRSF